MDREKYSFKDVFRLRIRICLLIVLVVFILGFIFIPEWEIEIETVEPIEPPITIIPASPDEVVNIVEIPKDDVGKLIEKQKYEKEEEKQDEERDVDSVNNSFFNDRNPDVKFGTPIFIPHDVKPKPLNLDKVKFEYPKSMTMLGVSGTIYLQLFIDKKGNVRNVVLMNSLHPTLDKVAVENAWKIKFSPAQQRDKPVAVWYAFWVEFKLE